MKAQAEQRRTPARPELPAVLSFGYDTQLLLARESAFAEAGFRVDSASSLPQVRRLVSNRRYRALVIGHRVPEDQRNQLAVRFRQRNVGGRVVFLYLGSIRNAEAADAVLSAAGSPSDLAIAISHQVQLAHHR